ncbi:hypothetical protein [Pseudoalteromonas luteoviolacea]|uniref:hypothetical protein n=1 Tax=Pseudoalteromonas luteoviolacea TaxID=43657 RepID=UPI0011466258|nr:hypothetical protein [Pseudoalteromonas luteoviolacea]
MQKTIINLKAFWIILSFSLILLFFGVASILSQHVSIIDKWSASASWMSFVLTFFAIVVTILFGIQANRLAQKPIEKEMRADIHRIYTEHLLGISEQFEAHISLNFVNVVILIELIIEQAAKSDYKVNENLLGNANRVIEESNSGMIEYQKMSDDAIQQLDRLSFTYTELSIEIEKHKKSILRSRAAAFDLYNASQALEYSMVDYISREVDTDSYESYLGIFPSKRFMSNAKAHLLENKTQEFMRPVYSACRKTLARNSVRNPFQLKNIASDFKSILD